MAQTNEMIIMQASQELAEAGKIKYTGRVFQAKLPDDTIVEFKETEPIHTYQHWKTRGYQVRKGETAVTKLTIWKHSPAKKDKETGEVIGRDKMFMKTAAFFSLSQVDKA